MAARKYVSINAGVLTEVQSTITSAGAGDEGKIVALDATGRLSNTFMPVGAGSETDSIVSSENLAAGNLVNIWSDVGVTKVRKADATVVGKEANGFVLAAVTAPAAAVVHRISQSNTQMSGLTPGSSYYLHTTAGGVTSTPPSASGNIVQYVGKAFDATTLIFDPKNYIVLA